MFEEMVILVNEQDQPLGVAEKLQAHQLGLLHRAFSIFIINNQQEVLLQQRHVDKYHCGGLWTNTCCSHPRANETVLAAAQRRLYEEMGLQLQLQVLQSFIYRAEFSNGLIEHEYDHVLLGHYKGETIKISPAEVQAYAWVSITALPQKIAQNPELYTPWLKPALDILIPNLGRKIG